LLNSLMIDLRQLRRLACTCWLLAAGCQLPASRDIPPWQQGLQGARDVERPGEIVADAEPGSVPSLQTATAVTKAPHNGIRGIRDDSLSSLHRQQTHSAIQPIALLGIAPAVDAASGLFSDRQAGCAGSDAPPAEPLVSPAMSSVARSVDSTRYDSPVALGCDGPPADGGLYDCPVGRLSLREDIGGFWGTLREDSVGVVNWHNGLLLGIAAGGAIAMRDDLDGRIRRNTAQHPDRWGEGSHALGKLGDFPVQIPALLGLWGYSVWQQDNELHEFNRSLISAYTISAVSTIVIKVAADTQRPSRTFNNGHYGFPSYHTSSSFAMAAVIDEYYGPKAGIPSYVLAGLIGWSRIDEQDHDLSDVFFGAALGYVVGKSVAGRHLRCDSRVRILPYSHPTDGGTGLMVDVAF
jgi:hypothetical protein